MKKSNEEIITEILQSLNNIDYILPEDIPNIDLYMDQVTTFMDAHLQESKRFQQDKILTKTMINNYTKNDLLPPPVKKKYSKEHMFLLIFIYYFKNFLSINDIQQIFNPLTEKYFNGKGDVSLEEIYEQIFKMEEEQASNIAKEVVKRYAKSKGFFNHVENENDREFLSNFSFICMLSFDVYIKKTLIEKIIDQTLVTPQKEKTEKPKK